MKRRTADCGKLRRPLKRSKITEGIYGSTFLYLKFLLVWALVLMADFIIDFRFEYLWPFWLLLCSVYDSFKYQGLAFSVFFVCIAVTSDVICYLFIPVQWLFFAASTYVWVQYVWHTERGICLPTVSLWLLFVYIEASVRLREFKSLPFNLDLCRPFAAHCIGYPVVTLGFGFKSYISYRLRLRKQKDIQKENEFYVQLLQQALPIEQQNAEKQKALPSKQSPTEEVISNGVSSTPGNASTTTGSTPAGGGATTNTKKSSKLEPSPPTAPSSTPHPDKDLKKANNVTPPPQTAGSGSSPHIEDYQFLENNQQQQQQQQQNSHKRHNNINNYTEENLVNEQSSKTFSKANTATKATKLNSHKENVASTGAGGGGSGSGGGKKERGGGSKLNNTATALFANNKDEVISRLEGDIKRLKVDLQSSRNSEQELRSQINSLHVSEKCVKSEVYQLRQDNESLQTKLHNLVTNRQQDKQNLLILERKLADERKQRAILEQQMITERKTAKKVEEAATARAIAMAAATRGECTDSCKSRRRDLENDMMQARHDMKLREDKITHLEREIQTLRQYKDNQSETEVLMSALAAMQDKTSHLENSLSAETKLKLELFSALGEAKRQIELQQGHLARRELESDDFKSKIAELMALNPSTSTFTSSNNTCDTSPRFMNNFSPSPPMMTPASLPMVGLGGHVGGRDVLANSSLNPNACDYRPKINQ